MSVYYPSAPYAVPRATKNWAMSAMVLAILMILSSLPNVFQLQRAATLMGSRTPLFFIQLFASMLTMTAFVVTSAATLKAEQWGREALSYTAAFAIVVTLLSAALTLTLNCDPHYQAAMLSMLSAEKGNGSSLPSSTVSSIMNLTVMATIWVTVVMSIIQIVYCALLYRHMAGEPEKG